MALTFKVVVFFNSLIGDDEAALAPKVILYAVGRRITQDPGSARTLLAPLVDFHPALVDDDATVLTYHLGLMNVGGKIEARQATIMGAMGRILVHQVQNLIILMKWG